MTVATAERPAKTRKATSATARKPTARNGAATQPSAGRSQAPVPDNRTAQRAADRFKQLGDATRLRTLMLLAGGEMHVGALCEQLGIGQPACSHHLALLRHGGLISPRREGKNNIYGLTALGEQIARMARDAPW